MAINEATAVVIVLIPRFSTLMSKTMIRCKLYCAIKAATGDTTTNTRINP